MSTAYRALDARSRKWLQKLERRKLLNCRNWFERDTYLELRSHSHKTLIEVCINPFDGSWLAPGVVD